MRDYMVRAIAAHDQIRAFAISDREAVEIARRDHDTWPVCTAALGRALSAGFMMGFMMDGDKDEITLQLIGDGPAGGVTVTADPFGHAKGFVNNPHVDLPEKSPGHLDVGGAIGHGYLRVIKDMGLKEPYSGSIDLISGEVAEDLTYYFAESEQVPSSVGLGVLVNTDLTVKQSGGFIVQLMPDTEDSVIDKLSDNISHIDSVTQMLEKGLTPEQMLESVLDGFDVEFTDKQEVEFKCGCSRKNFLQKIRALSKEDKRDIAAEDGPIEVVCRFCGKKYTYKPEEII
ncbi:MAG: Hsp33 family molecular chaperone HslO [Lachnospiraceae bacterium]|uniref:33 kDa chaperonin n=1 Tax=Candidatus Weimeria bifida TaxID=2599074 RepID=A0A6N7IZI5_9FIRM|nr:Hsp33 family molecular chaperone HslO [Candidatus Weimeria bifida]RRF96611.1 MAG: Hsp33 family molecular chaperone HslO [Lachnospiraceae bacterium]